MASFDVTDLYTNVPLGETIQIFLEKLSIPGSDDIMGIPKNLFKEMLEMSVFNSVFTFDNKYYLQTDGLGMGLPLSPTLANIFLGYHESKWLEECPNEFKPSYYRRYMDDCFILFRCQEHAKIFLEYVNQKHANINFTCENEVNGKLPFLDCTVERRDNMFSTQVYRKSTFTGLGSSFLAFPHTGTK